MPEEAAPTPNLPEKKSPAEQFLEAIASAKDDELAQIHRDETARMNAASQQYQVHRDKVTMIAAETRHRLVKPPRTAN